MRPSGPDRACKPGGETSEWLGSLAAPCSAAEDTGRRAGDADVWDSRLGAIATPGG